MTKENLKGTIRYYGCPAEETLAGSGMAAILFSPVLTFIIENYGLDKAFLFQSVSVVVLSVITFLLIRNTPADKGILPYGQSKNENKISERDVSNSIGVIKNILEQKNFIS
jgi:sugar phosphate permease